MDDNDLNRELLVEFLDILGYEASSERDGRAGLESAQLRRPDAILLDIDMPVMTGLEMLEHLSDDDELSHIPVIMISGRDDMESVVHSIKLGATDFLAKPFNQTILQARLSSSLEKNALRDRERELLKTIEKNYGDLKKAEASRDALTHMIVHDLGNPLSVVMMNTQMLQMSAPSEVDGEALRKRLKHISTASASMESMIRSILDVSRMESGEMALKLELIDIPSLVAALLTQYQEMAAESGVEMTSSVDEDAQSIRVDRSLLERMLANLLSNAFKYAHSADRVLLEVSTANDSIIFVVEDNGEGIPVALHQRIFDKFYQVESREAGVRAGVGLGLAFCKMAAQTLGGSIRVETAAEGGSRFILTLPAG